MAASAAGSGSAMTSAPPMPDRAAEQPVPGDLVVDAQQLFADPLRLVVQDAVADVVAQRADVVDVVVQPFQLQQDRPDLLGGRVDRHAVGVLDGPAERQRVADGGVPADPFGQFDPVARGCGPRRVSRCRGARTTAGP